MPPPESRIAAIRAGLATLGLASVRRNDGDDVRIEADLPVGFPPDSWLALLAVLESADRFGLDDSPARGRSVWVLVTTTPPP